MNQSIHSHFYAASCATWATTTPERNLHQLLKLMDAEGLPYSLWFVPAPHDAHYSIEMYQPKIDGAQWCEFIEPNKRNKRKAA